MTTTVIYPGTFDPVTIWHLDIMKRSVKIFDKVIVAVAENANKKTMFDFYKRLDLVQRATVCITKKDIDEGCEVEKHGKIEVMSFKGLLADFAKEQNARLIVRGVRNATNFDYEFEMAGMNHSMDYCLDTVFLPTYESTQSLVNSLVKEIASNGGNISNFIPCCLKEEVEKYLAKRG